MEPNREPLTFSEQQFIMGMIADITSKEKMNSLVENDSKLDGSYQTLIEKIWAEATNYKRAGVRGQYEGNYHEHRFIIGVENKYEAPSITERLLGVTAHKRVGSRVVLCISKEPNGFPTDGLRIDSENHPSLTDNLNALFRAAEHQFQTSEVERLMSFSKG